MGKRLMTMKQAFILWLALLVGGAAWAQTDRTGKAVGPEADTNEIFVVVEQDPEFPGGMDALYQWIGSNYKWPASARECDAFGNVYVTFIIEKDGSVSNIKLLRDIGCGHGEAVVEMLQHMPKWKPGKQHGKKVRVQFNLPVKIELL